ncbi:hypothetical protein FGB62_75g011 [Gracilaria domingensis]|nr:hypothetical protein FGB62_75g011 [Gracilaria domingensis]
MSGEPSPCVKKTIRAVVTVPEGEVPVQIVVVAPPSVTGYRSAELVPAISGTTTPTASLNGGDWQGHAIDSLISATQIVVNSIPSAAASGGNEVFVVVSNSAGSSNAFALTYNNVVKAGVGWEQTFLKSAGGGKYSIKQVTSVTIGPDAKYSVGSLAELCTNWTLTKRCLSRANSSRPRLATALAFSV